MNRCLEKMSLSGCRKLERRTRDANGKERETERERELGGESGARTGGGARVGSLKLIMVVESLQLFENRTRTDACLSEGWRPLGKENWGLF